jgi:uncharacterized coiled-coil DUF342 family protein
LAGVAIQCMILEQVSKRILEKLERGKKPTTEDILLLYLDLTYKSIRDVRAEMGENIKGLRMEVKEEIRSLWEELGETANSLREEFRGEVGKVNKRIESLERRMDGLEKRIDGLQMSINEIYKDALGKLADTNRRIDKLYELLAEWKREVTGESGETSRP